MASLPLIRAPGSAWTLGVLTLWPPLYLAFFFAFVLSQVLSGLDGGFVGGGGAFVGVLVAHLLTILLSFALLAVYLVDVVQNQELSQGPDGRLVWLLVVIFVGMFAQPVYWWVHLRPTGAPFQRRMAWIRSVRAIDGP